MIIYGNRSGRRSRGRRPFAFVVLLVAVLAACTDAEPEAKPAPAPQQNVVDSIFPVEEEIRRFKAAMPAGPERTQLMQAAKARDELVQAFVRALEQHDTAVIRGLVLDQAEFIDLYYPASTYSKPPYKQSPALLWFLMRQESEKGISRLVQRYGGRPTGFSRYHCNPEPKVEGDVKLWEGCQVTWRLQPSPLRAFGAIIERNGRFKFLSYANDL